MGIAGALARRGHDVRFLGHPVQEGIIGRGFAFRPFEKARPWPPTGPDNPNAPPAVVGVFADRGMGADLVATLAKEPADAVVIDHLLWGALSEARGVGVPYATLVHTLLGQQRGVWSGGPGAALASSLGFEPAALWRSSGLMLVATMPALDPDGTRDLPSHALYTGPVWQGRPVPASGGTPPLVLVSLSTFPLEGQAEALQRILDALATLNVRAIATTGPSVEPALLRAPANVELMRFAPHEDLMPRASLVISHGGHSTVTAALARDLPMLLLPMFPLGDQPAVARAVEACGAGLALAKESDVGAIRAAVSRLLGDPSYRTAAAALGKTIREKDGAEVAADALLRLVGTQPNPSR
jgi:UDP:flavonoid glycosyltransferase YjiC (YdhE family)